MIKKAFLKASFIAPFALLPMGVVLACSNTTNANDKPGDNPGTDNPSDQQPSGSETVAKTNLKAQDLNLTGTISESNTVISGQWIFENKEKLLNGSIKLFTSANDILSDSILLEPKNQNDLTTGVLTFTLDTGKSFNSNGKPSVNPTIFKIEISEFKMPKNADLEKAKNKVLHFYQELKEKLILLKASHFSDQSRLVDLEAIGVLNNLGFKITVALDKTNNSAGFDDELGQLFLQITLKRKTNETETFKHTIEGFKTNAQEEAEKDNNLNPTIMFNDSFTTRPSDVIKVKTNNPNYDLGKVDNETELLKLISINPKINNLQQDQMDENAILKKQLPEGYELKFVKNSIKQSRIWNASKNEIEAFVYLAKKNTNERSGSYKLIVNGFNDDKNSIILEEWVNYFQQAENPLKSPENMYLSTKASTILTTEELEKLINSVDSVSSKSEIVGRGITFELDKTVEPTDQNDNTGSLKAQFIFKWKDEQDANLEVKKVITLYGFQLNS